MKKLGRVSSTEFKIRDLVRLQNAKTREWDMKGDVEQVISQDGGSNTYTVLGDQGGQYLRNGRFKKLRVTKAKKLLHVTFGPLHSAGG